MFGVALIYLVVLLALIYFTGFFGLLEDSAVSRKQFTLFFFLKALAIPAFYLVYAQAYGGLEKFDAGVFYNDSKAINAFAKENFSEYLKVLFGLQDDSEGSYFYTHALANTYNWDNGKIRDFFYNDNRVLIRLHSLLHFIAFDSYFVHALFSCFLSFIGIGCLYKAFKDLFYGRELALLAVFCFFPSLWFYTAALLKEGLTLFVLGNSLYALKKIIYHQENWRTIVWFLFLVFVSFFLKPYLLCFAIACFAVFFTLQRRQPRFKILAFSGILCGLAFLANAASVLVKHKSLPEAALARQRIFADAAKGGIFLLDSVKFVRLEYDSNLVTRLDAQHYTIKAGSPYIYWEHTHQQDTLFCAANTDTLTHYKLAYSIGESRSNLGLDIYSGHALKVLAACLYYSLFHPLFLGAKGLQLIASFENLLLLVAFLLLTYSVLRNRKAHFPAFVFVFFACSLCILVGLTTPNSGAIFRYRSPAAIFILAAALYYLPFGEGWFLKRRR